MNVKLDIETIVSLVCIYYDIEKDELFKHCRIREKLFRRQVFHYLAYKYTNCSYRAIGEYYSHVNNWKIKHCTVIHSIDKVNNEIETDKKLFYHMINFSKLLSLLPLC
jgi:chromosomal replication initiation ATPase DnaA